MNNYILQCVSSYHVSDPIKKLVPKLTTSFQTKTPSRIVKLSTVNTAYVFHGLHVFYGERRVGEFQQTTSGDVAVVDADMQPVNSRLVCRSGEPIVLELLTSQSGTNPLAILLDIKDIRPARGGY